MIEQSKDTYDTAKQHMKAQDDVQDWLVKQIELETTVESIEEALEPFAGSEFYKSIMHLMGNVRTLIQAVEQQRFLLEKDIGGFKL